LFTKPKQHVIEIIYGRGKFVGDFNMGTLLSSFFLKEKIYIIKYGDSHDCMVVGFITTYAISAHHH
jgi:hypothetical protein